MGSLLSQPETTKSSDQGEGLGLRYGLSSMQGWRLEMEDAHAVQLGLKDGMDDWSYFAVFDGHAGKETAKYASWHLLDYILKDIRFQSTPEHQKDSSSLDSPEASNQTPGQQLETIDSQANSQANAGEPSDDGDDTHDQNSKISDSCENTNPIDTINPASLPNQVVMVRDAISSAFLKIDQTMRNDNKDMSGCTAVCTFISPTHIFIANCGDSRAVLYDGENLRFATEDHKPLNPKERKRIIDAGGTATDRINGTLAVSRALGDFDFKKDRQRGPCEQLVSPEPEVTVIERKKNDEFLILACDGIWDVIDNDDLCKFVSYTLKIEPNLENVCSSILDVCLRKGSRDNMSIIIIVFGTEPKVDQEMVEQVKKVDEALLRLSDKVQEKFGLMSPQHGDPLHDSSCGFTDFLSVIETWVSEERHLVPPGAGLQAKYDLLRERYDKNIEKCQQNLQE